MRIPPETRPTPPEGFGGTDPVVGLRPYLIALVITILAITSQYVLPWLIPAVRPVYGSFLGGLLIVYGIPIAAFATLVGPRSLRRWAGQPGAALWEGLRWYSLLTLLSLAVLLATTLIYLRVDPEAVRLLTRPNPILKAAASNPGFWIAFSFAVGAIEELIFRGWIFGYWIARGTRRWGWHAIWTSALFAGVHLYYGTTYGIAAPLVYPSLFLIGLAFAGTYRASGGNLWVVALLHGIHDAAAFLTLVSTPLALGIAYGIVAVGGIIALVDLLRGSGPPAPPPPGWPPAPPFPPPPPMVFPPAPGIPPPPAPGPELASVIRPGSLPGHESPR